MRIERFTATEGGVIRSWNKKKNDCVPSNKKLRSKRRKSNGRKFIFIRRTPVHSFFTACGRRWDVVNGWNQPQKKGKV